MKVPVEIIHTASNLKPVSHYNYHLTIISFNPSTAILLNPLNIRTPYIGGNNVIQNHHYQQPERRCGQNNNRSQPIAGLIHAGKGILFIDMDPQANVTINLLPQDSESELTIKDVFYGEKLDHVVSPSVVDGLDIVPSTLSFAAIESEIISKIGCELILKKL